MEMSGAGAPDFFYREAQHLVYVARSAFKIQQQYKIIKPGSSVCSCCLASGCLSKLGSSEQWWVVVGIDIKKAKVPSLHCDARVQTVSADVMNLSRNQLRAFSPKQKGFSVVLLDMCPSVSGITTKDAALSTELGVRALDLALGPATIAEPVDDTKRKGHVVNTDYSLDDNGVLQPVGHFVILHMTMVYCNLLLFMHFLFLLGCFRDPDLQTTSRKASRLRPKAIRSSPRGIYLICCWLKVAGRINFERQLSVIQICKPLFKKGITVEA